MTSKLIYTLAFILVTCFTFASQNMADTSKIKFKGKNQKVAYSSDRKIGEVEYEIQNLTDQDIRLKLVGAFLVRGKHADPLENGKISIFAKGKYRKQKFIELHPKQKVKFRVEFKPFQLYTGSDYTVRTILEVDGKRIASFRGIPIKICDSLTETEAHVTT